MTVTLSFEVHRNEKDGHFGSQFARLTIADAVRDILTALGQWPRERSLINQRDYSGGNWHRLKSPPGAPRAGSRTKIPESMGLG